MEALIDRASYFNSEYSEKELEKFSKVWVTLIQKQQFKNAKLEVPMFTSGRVNTTPSLPARPGPEHFAAQAQATAPEFSL